DPAMCQNFIDHVPPPSYWALLCNQIDVEFLDQLNANSAQPTCIVFELLKKAEHEVMEVIRLCGRVSELEAMTAAKVEELASLGAQNVELLGKVSGLESVHDGLKEQVL
ncbi:hypothetical protein Tco_0288204, partial [Tanacetum coccineum]